MHWFSTGLLIALAAGTAAWTGYLLRRLFVVEPAEGAATTTTTATTATADTAPSAGPNAEEPNA